MLGLNLSDPLLPLGRPSISWLPARMGLEMSQNRLDWIGLIKCLADWETLN